MVGKSILLLLLITNSPLMTLLLFVCLFVSLFKFADLTDQCCRL